MKPGPFEGGSVIMKQGVRMSDTSGHFQHSSFAESAEREKDEERQHLTSRGEVRCITRSGRSVARFRFDKSSESEKERKT